MGETACQACLILTGTRVSNGDTDSGLQAKFTGLPHFVYTRTFVPVVPRFHSKSIKTR
jgi:hypothetical protein